MPKQAQSVSDSNQDGGPEGSENPTSKNGSRELIDPQTLPSVRQNLLSKIVPTSLLPMATANGMLVIGSSKKTGVNLLATDKFHCFFGLPEYLLVAGSISLAFIVVGVLGRYVLGWILEDNVITKGESRILKALQILGYGLIVSEVILLLAGTIVVFPNLPKWQYKKSHQPNYCEFGMVVFASVVIALAWFYLLLAALCALYVICIANRERDEPVGLPTIDIQKMAKEAPGEHVEHYVEE